MTRWSVVVAAAVLIALAALAVAPVPPRAGGASVLRYALTGDIFNFDPTQLADGNYIMINQLYDSLIREDQDLHPRPRLATSWEFLDNGLVLRLHLRRGVVFDSGRAFGADDVVYNIHRYQDPAVGANVRLQALSVKDVRKVDDATVDLVLDKPDPAIFDLLDFLYVVDRDGVAGIKTTPAGTGPFRLAGRVPGTSSEFAAFDRYWDKGTPALDRVDVRVVADDPALIANLTSRAVDVIQGPQPIHLQSLKQQGYRVTVETSSALFFDVLMNVTRGPFKDKRVREAISLAIDRGEFVRLFFQGIGKPAWLPAARAAHVTYPTGVDAARAKTLLAQAGYAGGFSTTMLVPAAIPGAPALGQVIQSDLAPLGVRVRLELIDLAQIRARWFGSDFEMTIHQYGRANRDPDSLLRGAVVFRPQDNITRYDSGAYAALVDRGATTMDPRARGAAYGEVAKILLDEAFTVTVAAQPRIFVTAPGVDGLTTNLEGMPILGGVHVR